MLDRDGVGMTETITIEPMRRRDIKSVVAIEEQVYPRPWTAALFQSELALTETRCYLVARHGRSIAGYGGIMMALSDGHITTLAVDPLRQRTGIAMRLLLRLVREAISRGAEALTLEVRLSNRAAQELYRGFGFVPVGVRKDYYDFPTGREDALIMWAHDVDGESYEDLLAGLEARTVRA
jgi:[ribosomal protein S18]-alanine N-acetyltransferase